MEKDNKYDRVQIKNFLIYFRLYNVVELITIGRISAKVAYVFASNI